MIAHQRGFPRGPEKDTVTLNKLTTKLQKDPRTKHPGVLLLRENER
jgi:hypothetical protein